MKFTPPVIYPITDIKSSGLSHLEQAKLLINAGATLLQLRDKSSLSSDLFRSVKDVVAYANVRGVSVIVNDRVDIALCSGASGVHLGQDDLPAEKARELLGDHAIIGFSTHSVEQAIAAANMPVDYIAIGPVFFTGTKADPDPVIGLEGIRRVREAIKHLPLVAIGGIDETNVLDVLRAGADSCAIISAITRGGEALGANFRRLTQIAIESA